MSASKNAAASPLRRGLLARRAADYGEKKQEAVDETFRVALVYKVTSVDVYVCVCVFGVNVSAPSCRCWGCVQRAGMYAGLICQPTGRPESTVETGCESGRRWRWVSDLGCGDGDWSRRSGRFKTMTNERMLRAWQEWDGARMWSRKKMAWHERQEMDDGDLRNATP